MHHKDSTLGHDPNTSEGCKAICHPYLHQIGVAKNALPENAAWLPVTSLNGALRGNVITVCAKFAQHICNASITI